MSSPFTLLIETCERLSPPGRVGWREASTITGFCSRHDSETFAPLERGPFVGSEKQCFLIGYRAICHEIFAKEAPVAAYSVASQFADRGRSPEVQLGIQERLRWHNLGARKGLRDLMRVKEQCDRALLTKNFAAVASVGIEFSGALSIASSGAMSPDFDVNGRQLQVLHGSRKPVTVGDQVRLSADNNARALHNCRPVPFRSAASPPAMRSVFTSSGF